MAHLTDSPLEAASLSMEHPRVQPEPPRPQKKKKSPRVPVVGESMCLSYVTSETILILLSSYVQLIWF